MLMRKKRTLVESFDLDGLLAGSENSTNEEWEKIEAVKKVKDEDEDEGAIEEDARCHHY